ncbi:MAG: GntR family transcriptional regulator [Pseudomonadales bacterium]|nr:GntR family transcriptional regulator [Pseudomonadales bacterium]
MEKTLPDYIVDELIARIYVRHYQPGFRLPAERGFAEELNVDRTSLRMALRTLNRMKVIQSVRGSGITVMDYTKHAGLDFLGAIFDIPELELGSQLKLEGLETFNSLIPGLLYESVKDTIDAKEAEVVRDILARQMQVLDSGPQGEEERKQLVKLEVDLQETLIQSRSSLLGGLMVNSTKAIRETVIAENFELIDIREHVRFHQEMIFNIGIGKLPVDDIVGFYYKFLDDFTRPLRDKYNSEFVAPRMLASPLENALQRRDF